MFMLFGWMFNDIADDKSCLIVFDFALNIIIIIIIIIYYHTCTY